MADAGWSNDPTGRHELRYFDGTNWSGYVSDDGRQANDPFEDDATTEQVSTGPAIAAPSEQADESASPRRWPWVVGIVVALILGGAIGAGAESGQITDLKAKLTQAQHDRDSAVSKVNNREARRRANLAEAAATRARLARAEKQKSDAAAKATKDAADKAAADAAAQQKAAADLLAAAQAQAAKMGTIEADGVYSIGTDKSPGRYHTDGSVGCYFAVLNSPDTFDIATNDNVDGPSFADLPAGKFFETKRCATWTKVG